MLSSCDIVTGDRSGDENRRLLILSKVQEGVYTTGQAAKLMGLSPRQDKRLRSRFRAQGAAALAHGNRLSELLAEREGFRLSRSTVRRILVGAGVRSPRTQGPTQFGRLLHDLDIRLILARSPQAKGRIERIWKAFPPIPALPFVPSPQTSPGTVSLASQTVARWPWTTLSPSTAGSSPWPALPAAALQGLLSMS